MTYKDVDPSAHRPASPAITNGPWTRTAIGARGGKVVGTRLVLAQAGSDGGFARETWYLHQDLVFALRLEREEDAWFSSEEGWVEVVRL